MIQPCRFKTNDMAKNWVSLGQKNRQNVAPTNEKWPCIHIFQKALHCLAGVDFEETVTVKQSPETEVSKCPLRSLTGP